MKRFVLIILVAGLAPNAACVLLALGEGKVPVCDGISFDNINGKRYILTRAQSGVSSETGLRFNITKDCEVDYKKDLTHLLVKSIEIRDPRSSSGAIVVIHTVLEDKAGEEVTCTAPLVEFEPLEFLCPTAQNLKYVLTPQE